MIRLFIIIFSFIILFVFYCSAGMAMSNGQKKLMSINTAKILAERNIIETIYGLKLRYEDEVHNIITSSFKGTTETKTGKRKIKGIKFDEVKYDAKKDVAMVTASVKLSDVKDIVAGDIYNFEKLGDKVIHRTAFASSTPANSQRLAALRAAEINAYKNLYKKLVGSYIESSTEIENHTLKSDTITSSVVGTLIGAEVTGFSWEGKGKDAIAVVNLSINLKFLSELLGRKIFDTNEDNVSATGYAAIKIKKKSYLSNYNTGNHIVTPRIINTDIDIMGV